MNNAAWGRRRPPVDDGDRGGRELTGEPGALGGPGAGTAGRGAVIAVLLGAILFGTAGTARAIGPIGTTSSEVGAVRLLVGGLALLAVLMARGHSPRSALRLWRTRAGLLAGACTAAYQVCFFAAMQATGVALGTLVTVGSAPLLAGLLAWIALGHRPTRAWVLATVLCVAGLALLSEAGLGVGTPAGLVLALAAGLAAATYNVAAKRLLDDGVPVLDVLTGTFLLGGLVLLPILLSGPLGWLLSAAGLGLALYLGVATMALANTLMVSGLRVLAPAPVTTLTLADPVTATVLGVLVLGEVISPPARAGLVLLLLGLLLQGVAAARRPAVRRAPEIVPLG